MSIRQLHPHPGRARVLSVPSGPVATLDTGSHPGAPTVLLLPGYTGSKEDFAPILGPLSCAGFRAVAVDLPGQHESPGPDDAARYTTDGLAEAVQLIADTVDPQPIHLVGHSFGGLVARAAAIATPARWRSLTLLDSGPAALDGARRERIDHLEPVLLAKGIEAVIAANEDLERAAPGWQEPPADLVALLRDRFRGSAKAGLLGMAEALRTEPDRVDALRASGLDILVAFGVHDDAWTTASQQQMAERLGARTVVIENAGHSPALDNPARTAAALTSFFTDTDRAFHASVAAPEEARAG